MRGWAYVWVCFAASCYSPSYKDCAIPCTLDCPSGFHCVGDRCRPTSETATCPVVDASQQVDTGGCWSYTPLNFDPCALPPRDPTFMINSNTTLDTDTMMDANGITHGVLLRPGVWMIHVAAFSVPLQRSLTIQGSNALLIVSDDDAHIDGAITVYPTTLTRSGCGTGAGYAAHNVVGQGGGGGGFGSSGGMGGKSGEGGTTTTGNTALAPTTTLAPGCAGQDGQSIGNAMGGMGGLAGNALQITSNGSVSITSTIFINGGGGKGGGLDTTSGCGSGACGAGGGGGGTGGTLIIEGNMIVLSGASACAIGGTGGQGAAAQANGGGDAGPNYIMSCVAAGSSTNAAAGGRGGAGSSSAAPGLDGGNGVSASIYTAGGGGGGGAGSITFHGPASGGATIDPLETDLPLF